MTNAQKRFIISAGILLGTVLTVSQIIFTFFADSFPMRITSILVVWSATCACHLWLIKTVSGNPNSFGRVFLMQTFGKLMLYIGFFVFFLIFFKENKIFFTIHFFVVYIIFATFDVSLILKFVKKN